MKNILKGSSLAEFGIPTGLVSVMSIGAVLGTGQQTSQIFCEARTSATSSPGKPAEPNFADHSNGDISDWCVSHISSEPSVFGHSVAGKSLVWGAACAP